MASPFPGMDPYLEERSLWPDVHQRLIAYISETLQPQVRPKYIARIGERIEVASIERGYIPDVLIVQPPREPATTHPISVRALGYISAGHELHHLADFHQRYQI